MKHHKLLELLLVFVREVYFHIIMYAVIYAEETLNAEEVTCLWNNLRQRAARPGTQRPQNKDDLSYLTLIAPYCPLNDGKQRWC